MASGIPLCSLENKLAYGTWDSSVFVLNEFINPKIGNMEGSRNGILVEEEQVFGDIDFVRGGGEHCPLSNGGCEGAGGPSTAESVLWDDWEDFRFSGSVKQSGDLCSYSNTDFHIEGPDLRGKWNDGEDFVVDSLGSKFRIDCTTMLLAVADWMNTLQVERENFEETACYRDMCPDLKKGRTNEDHAMLRKSQSSAGSNYDWYTPKTCPGQHKGTWELVPFQEPPNLNELIHYGDYEPICWDAIETTRVEPGATAFDMVSCYEDYEAVKQVELLDKIELVDPSYKGAHLTSLKDGALLGDFQAFGEAGFPRQPEESNDRQQESPPKDRDDTGNLRLQAPLGALSTVLGDLLSRQLEETNDRWKESPAKNRDDTGNIRVQAALGALSLQAGFPRQPEESNDRQQESPPKDRDDTGNLRLQAPLGALSTALGDLLSRQLEETNDRWQERPAKNRDDTGNIRVQAALGALSLQAGFPRQPEESNDRQQESPPKDRDDTGNLRLQAPLGALSTALGDLLSRQLEETNDRWQESPAKNRDDTGNIRVQAALGDLSIKTSAYYDSCQIDQGGTKTVLGSMEGCSDGELQRGEPHFGLLLTLSYLDLQDLISVEKVCKFLHTAVKGEPFLWQNIHVEHPLSERLTDDALLGLAARSRGRLRKLSLLECQKITDDGLKQVLDISPNLTKLCLPGCTRLTADGIVRNVRAHKECSVTGLKQLRIGGLFGITREHLDQLNYLLDGGLQQRSQTVKPRFYPNGRYLSYDDDSTIDIEACPICGDARLVYDCTKESCQNQTDHTVRECRACTFCIARCDVCGKCIDGEYEETFNLDMRCVDCVRAFQPPRITIRRVCL